MERRFAVLDSSWLTDDTARLVVAAPRVARHARPGQFVIVRNSIDGERIPLTVADADAERGTITLVVQSVGRTTSELTSLDAGASLADVLGPLGRATEVEHFGTCAVVVGGVGAAIGLPVARAYAAAGNEVICVLGARSAGQLIMAEELAAAADELIVATEDGSNGIAGLVTDALSRLLSHRHLDRVFTVGPVGMMEAVAGMTRVHGICTIASLNPIMVDGTGMCGGCRVTVGGSMRFACVDGPDFDAHEVDFDSLRHRNRAYEAFEACQFSLMDDSP